jgi:hypothetical protein
MNPHGLLLLGCVLFAGCDVCTTQDTREFPRLLCAGDAGPASVRLRPSTFHGNASISGQTCVASVDAGVIELRLQGTVCSHASQSQPIAQVLEAECVVTGLSPGTWKVGASTSAVLVRDDGGVDLTACGK